jgi:hypothetical protein
VSAAKLFLLAALFAATAGAHVGSPDVFFQGKAGPYPLLVAIRPPDVIPGVARIEVRTLSDGVKELRLTPTPMTGEAAKHPPVADIAVRSATDAKYFEGSLWLMTMGSWVVHIHASGAAGEGDMAVPVPAVAIRIKPMNQAVGYFLLGMMVFLVAGVVAIVGAAVREARVDPGLPTARWTTKTVAAMAFTTAFLIFALWRGNVWWAEDAAISQQRLFKPLGITASVMPDGHAEFRLDDPGWLRLRRLDDLIPDHGHLMHLFLVRWPAMDEVFHLHPDQTATGFFSADLPSIPAGDYRIFGDVVHENGFAETAVGQVALPEIHGKPLAGDDAGGPATADLGNGYTMVWQHAQTNPIHARQVTLFSFVINGPDGKPVNDLEPYMGMGGHAEFVKRDGSVFAHLHPTGTVSMASAAVASPEGMAAMHETSVGPTVSFPYGVPTPGQYRIFVQLKRAGKVETGTFDLNVI